MKAIKSKHAIVMSALMLVSASSIMAAGTDKSPLATVDGTSITSQEFQSRIDSAPAQYAEALKTKENRTKVLDDMINEKLLINAAQKKGFDKSSDYKKDLQNLQNQLLLTTYARDLIKNNAVSDAEAKAYYDANAAQYAETEFRSVSHILLKTEAEANEVYGKIKAGSDFAGLAKEKSQDPNSAPNGGNLGYFAKGQMLPELDAAVFTMGKGQFSAPVKTQYGFHVVRLDEIKTRQKIEFETAKEQIRAGLLGEKNRKTLADQIESLKKTAKIKRDDSKL